MKKKVLLAFHLKNKPYASRETYYVPKVGDEVRFNNKAYKIQYLIWCYDEQQYPNKVNLSMVKIKENKND